VSVLLMIFWFFWLLVNLLQRIVEMKPMHGFC
jgi:hypothetical protein